MGFDGNSGAVSVCSDGGVTFTLADGNGLYHSTNSGASFTNLGQAGRRSMTAVTTRDESGR
jgi:hypothetical protein